MRQEPNSLKEPVSQDDWYPGILVSINTVNGSQGTSLKELFDQAVVETGTNRESAQGLQAFYLWRRKDPEKVNAIFLELGILFKFS